MAHSNPMGLIGNGKSKAAFLQVAPMKYVRSNSHKGNDPVYDTIQENENEEGLGSIQIKNFQNSQNSIESKPDILKLF
jgi:hypothetical protein